MVRLMAERWWLTLSERNFPLRWTKPSWKYFGNSLIQYLLCWLFWLWDVFWPEWEMTWWVTHVVVIDYHYRVIMGAYTMPVKNNLFFLEEVFTYVSWLNKLCKIYPCCLKNMTIDVFYQLIKLNVEKIFYCFDLLVTSRPGFLRRL